VPGVWVGRDGFFDQIGGAWHITKARTNTGGEQQSAMLEHFAYHRKRWVGGGVHSRSRRSSSSTSNAFLRSSGVIDKNRLRERFNSVVEISLVRGRYTTSQ